MKDPHIQCMVYMRRFFFGLVYVINTWSIEDVILVLTAHGQMHRLIHHVEALELAFLFIDVYEQKML